MARSFNANFITEKNKRDQGAAPRNLLEFGFATPVKLSDSDVVSHSWDGINLLSNADMELATVWLDAGDYVTTNERSSEQAHAGSYSRKLVVGHGSGSIEHPSARFTTVTGVRYRITARFYRAADTSPVHVTVRNGADTADVVAVDSSALALGVWTAFAHEYTETAGGALAFVTFTAESGTTTFIDDLVVEIEEVTYGANLVPNYDMELDTIWQDDPWPASTLIAQTRSAEQAHAGSYSRKIEGGLDFGGCTNSADPFALVSGDTYRVGVWAYQDSVSGAGAFPNVLLYDGDGTTILSDVECSVAAEDTWEHFEYEVTAAISGAGARIELDGFFSFVGYFDDIAVQKKTTAWSGVNLVANGDMELAAGWDSAGALVTTNERSTEQVYAGTYSRKLVVAAVSSGITHTTDPFTTVAGKVYRFGYWVYRAADTSAIEAVVRNGAGTADILSESTALSLGAWQYISHQFTETAGGALATITLNAAQDTITYFDDLVVETQLDALEYAGLVKAWGFVDSSAGQVPGRSIVGQVESSDLALTIINSQSPRFSDYATAADPIEGVTVTLYQWFAGTDLADKEPIFVGVVRGQPEYNEQDYRLTVKGIWHKYDREIGSELLLSAADYPDIDLEDIGRMANIAYGTLTDIRCPAIDSGAVDNLFAAIDSPDQTSLELSSASRFPASGTLGCELEEITYTGNDGKILTGLTRGANGTTAATHDAAMVCWEIATEFVYQLAGHPIKAAYELFVDGFRVTDVVTFYTGQSGDEKAGFAGQAVAVIPARITRASAVDLLVNDGLTINDAIDVVDTIGVNDTIGVSDTILVDDTIGVSDTISVSDLIGVSDTITVSDPGHAHAGSVFTEVWELDYAVSTGAPSINSTTAQLILDRDYISGIALYAIGQQLICHKAQYRELSGTPYQYRVCATFGDMPSGSSITVAFGSSSITGGSAHANTTLKDPWTAAGTNMDTWTEWNNETLDVSVGANVAGMDLLEVWVEVQVTPGAPSDLADVSKSGGATKTGSASKAGSASKSGAAAKTGAASKTGSAAKSGGATKGGSVTREGAVTLAGNSVADVEVGTTITANFDGWADDALGTITGTANLLLARPDHVIEHLLTYYCGLPPALIGSSFATSGTFYATNAYSFALLINQPIRAGLLLSRLSVQCRSRFFVTPAGFAELRVSQLGQASGHAIPATEIKAASLAIRQSAEADLVNTFTILWQRDWRLTGPDAYQGATPFADATSVGRYGTREPAGAELFYFDAVVVSAMVDHVGAYWLSFLKDSRKLPSFAVFLDNLEIEPGDLVDLTHPLDNMAGFVVEVLKIRQVMGSAQNNILDRLEILAVEN